MEEFDFETWHRNCFFNPYELKSKRQIRDYNNRKALRKEGWDSHKAIIEYEEKMERLKPTIKPCPFCGSPGKITYGGFGEIAVRCSNDNCGGSLGAGIWFNEEEKAIEIWNIRVVYEEDEVCSTCYGTGLRGFGGLYGDPTCPMCHGLKKIKKK